MEIYSALIVEDVKSSSDYVKQRISELCPQIKTISQAFTLNNAYNDIIVNNYDILFLDIQMPDGTSFDLLKRLSNISLINFEIIFITGESAKEYTLRAIKYSALDFLYKPLDDDELISAVNKAINKLSNRNHNNQIKLLLDRITETQNNKYNKIAFYIHNGIVELVDVDDIIYLKADGVISNVFLNCKQKLVTNRNIGFYKDILILDYDFVSISNSLLVNRKYIKRYNNRELTIQLTTGENLYVSRRHGKELKDNLSNNSSKGMWNKFVSLFK